MAKPEFRNEIVKPLLQLLDNSETMAALREVFRAEFRSEKDMTGQEASRRDASFVAMIQHEAKAAAWDDFEGVIRRACGL